MPTPDTWPYLGGLTEQERATLRLSLALLGWTEDEMGWAGLVSVPGSTVPGMTETPADQPPPTPVYVDGVPSHVPPRTPSEPNVVKRTETTTTTTQFDAADVEDDGDA